MGGRKARRFSASFIDDEKLRLKKYREIFREVIKGMQMKNMSPDSDLSLL